MKAVIWDSRQGGGFMKIEGFLSNVHQLDRSTTFRVLVRFQNSWYLFCLARSETFENGNYNSEIDDLPTLWGVTVKRFSEKTVFGKMVRCTSPPNFGELEKIFSGETFFLSFFLLKSSIISFISATLEHQRMSVEKTMQLWFHNPPPCLFYQTTAFIYNLQ